MRRMRRLLIASLAAGCAIVVGAGMPAAAATAEVGCEVSACSPQQAEETPQVPCELGLAVEQELAAEQQLAIERPLDDQQAGKDAPPAEPCEEPREPASTVVPATGSATADDEDGIEESTVRCVVAEDCEVAEDASAPDLAGTASDLTGELPNDPARDIGDGRERFWLPDTTPTCPPGDPSEPTAQPTPEPAIEAGPAATVVAGEPAESQPAEAVGGEPADEEPAEVAEPAREADEAKLEGSPPVLAADWPDAQWRASTADSAGASAPTIHVAAAVPAEGHRVLGPAVVATAAPGTTPVVATAVPAGSLPSYGDAWGLLAALAAVAAGITGIVRVWRRA